jgi:hypothetical protein
MNKAMEYCSALLVGASFVVAIQAPLPAIVLLIAAIIIGVDWQ